MIVIQRSRSLLQVFACGMLLSSLTFGQGISWQPGPGGSRPQSPQNLQPTLQLDWALRYDHGVWNHDGFQAVAFDAQGNIFAVGGSLSGGPNYSYEVLCLKVAPTGSILWERRYDSPGSGFDDGAVDLVVAPDGAVTVLAEGPGSTSDQDVLLFRYDPQGNLIWQTVWDHYWSDSAEAVVQASDGSLYVLAHSYTVGSVTDVVLLKYSDDGVLLWERFYHGGYGTDSAVDLGLDSQENVLLAGYSIAPGMSTNFDWLGLKYDANGQLLWSTTIAGAIGWPDYCWGMAVSPQDELLMTGYLVNNTGIQDYTTACLDSSGNLLWLRSEGTGTGGGQKIMADPSGRVISVGGSTMVAFDSAGNRLWNQIFGAPGLSSGSAKAVALHPRGDILVGGSIWEGSLGTQYFLLAADPLNGTVLSTAVYGTANFESPASGGLEVHPSGKILQVGSSPNSHDNDGLLLQYRY
ncbi:MAG: hypothetical protein DWQ01_03030 [Planctomycetota bacterium]|nr:MAG: hypothetical protein DWQ01_03030 [Planctomycetota bacterium]